MLEEVDGVPLPHRPLALSPHRESAAPPSRRPPARPLHAIPKNDVDFGEDEVAIAERWCKRSGIPYLGRADIGHDVENKIVPFGAPRRLEPTSLQERAGHPPIYVGFIGKSRGTASDHAPIRASGLARMQAEAAADRPARRLPAGPRATSAGGAARRRRARTARRCRATAPRCAGSSSAPAAACPAAAGATASPRRGAAPRRRARRPAQPGIGVGRHAGLEHRRVVGRLVAGEGEIGAADILEGA